MYQYNSGNGRRNPKKWPLNGKCTSTVTNMGTVEKMYIGADLKVYLYNSENGHGQEINTSSTVRCYVGGGNDSWSINGTVAHSKKINVLVCVCFWPPVMTRLL